MKQKLLLLAIVVASLGFMPSTVKAEMYGEEAATRQIIVDKDVRFFGKTDWQDNITASQLTFAAGNGVDFRIIVKNSGEEVLKNIEVFDYLPDDVNFDWCSNGCERNGQQLKWPIVELKPGEERFFEIGAKIAGAEQIKGKGLFCITNWAKAKAESGQQDEDGSQFCVESRILGEKTPETGFNFLLPVAASALLGSAGLLLKKK